ncbi:M28 family peptidase [Lyngbya aestuarii]|uniref:M28 family peptidase n=1 Tax=Lyngbya aestuarii TaxID=118322 RepID=UPI0003FC9806|nr:M28 family peptidase [Lyngbya aestuarii]
MRQSSSQSRFQVKIVNRSALIRLAILFMVLLFLGVWAWLTMFRMPQQSYNGQLPALQPEEIALQNSLKQDVQKLAGEIGVRNIGQYEQLNAAKTFLEMALTQADYEVKIQEYKIQEKSFYNLEAEHLGTEKPNEIIVIGAHYDSAFTSPGANDNGTGAAATLELARIFANQSTQRTIRFVEFTNEEPPFLWTENMGSLVYAKQLHKNNENVVAMFSLETMGYFSDAEDSQKYPLPVIGLLYPNRGHFISFIGNLNSSDLVRKTVGSFRRHVQFPSQGVSLPGSIPGVGWSDQWSFWQQGYQGIMITDTAPYRYPNYHTEEDTADQIDFEKLARVVAGLAKVISELAK